MSSPEARTLPRGPDPQLDALYREYAPFVWRSLRRLGVDDHALEDACQDVFVVAARRLADFESRSSMQTWLFGIAMRVQRSRRRTLARHARKLQALEREPERAKPDAYARNDAQRVLASMLAELDEAKRAVFVLVELEGLSVVEVAEGLGANPNTVYTRLRAARKALRTLAEARAGARS